MTRNDFSFLKTYSVTLTRIKRACDLTREKLRKIFFNLWRSFFTTRSRVYKIILDYSTTYVNPYKVSEVKDTESWFFLQLLEVDKFASCENYIYHFWWTVAFLNACFCTYNSSVYTKHQQIILICWLFVCFVFFVPLQNFHSYGDVNIAGEGLQILTYARHLWPLSSEGS